jgi:hypothetical protein
LRVDACESGEPIREVALEFQAIGERELHAW